MSAGIYCITHLVSGKRYVGSSANVEQRLRQHRSELRRNLHHSPLLQRAWNKYGEDAFVFCLLCVYEPQALLWLEQRYLDTWSPAFNCAIYVDAGMRGRTHTSEAKTKMSQRKLGKRLDDDHCAALARAQTGHVVTEETRRKIAETLKGHVVSAESRAKMSASAYKRHEKKKRQQQSKSATAVDSSNAFTAAE